MEIRIRKIVSVSILPVAINTDRTTNQLDVLFFNKSRNRCTVPISRTFITASHAPEETHALHSNFVPGGHTLATAIDTTVTIRILTSLQLAVLAHWANAGRSNSSRRNRNKPCGKHRKAKEINDSRNFHVCKFSFSELIFHVIEST